MDSHLDLFLRAFDRLDADADACAALFADGGRLRYVDGRADEGAAAVRERLREYFADLSSTTHTLRDHWHEDGVWIGELEASYVLADHSLLGPVSKVFVVRAGPDGIELRVELGEVDHACGCARPRKAAEGMGRLPTVRTSARAHR